MHLCPGGLSEAGAGSSCARIEAISPRFIPDRSGPFKMDVVLLASNRPGTGKTALASALASRWGQQGHWVAYLRLGPDDESQEADTAYVTSLTTINGSPEGAHGLTVPRINPLGQTIGGLSAALADFRSEAAGLGYRLLLEVSPPKGEEPRTWALCGELAEAADASVIPIVDHAAMAEIDRLNAELRPVRQRLHGLLVNSMPPYRIRAWGAELLAQSGGDTDHVLGMIPEDRVMLSPTMGQVAEHLGAQWVLGQEKRDELVSRVLIGGNLMDPGVTYFGRYPEQAVVVRGDRPDIQLAALGSELTCLILTGGHQPIPYVYHEAQEQEVPLLVVESDTHATAEALGSVISWGTVHHQAKTERFAHLLEKHCEPGLLQQLLA